MRLVSALLVGSLWAPAAAAATPAEIYGGVDTVEISEEVKVSLLSLRNRPLAPVVVARVNGGEEHEGARFLLETATSIVRVSKGFAKDHGLEIRTKKQKGEEDLEYVSIEELAIGSLLLRDVTALVGEGSRLTLGLGALDNVAYAIQPSAGVVRFVPAAQGTALLEQLGGITSSYDVIRERIKVGKERLWSPE